MVPRTPKDKTTNCKGSEGMKNMHEKAIIIHMMEIEKTIDFTVIPFLR